MALMVTIQEAAKITGYETPGRFRRAVKRGAMPPAADKKTRPHLWSKAQLEAVLTPSDKKEETDPRLAALEERWGMR